MHFPINLQPYTIESHWLNPRVATRRLLFVYAHPDDESFGNAGSIARYSRDGVSVHYICATKGEVGDVKPELLDGYPDVATLRSTELAHAAHALNMAAYHFLGYRDSGMPNSPDNQHPQALVQAPVEQVAAQITAVMRAIQPQVVVTFNPYGGYGHPDHIAIHHATLMAFERSGDPHWQPAQIEAGLFAWTPRKLYYSTFSDRWLKRAIQVLKLTRKDPTKFGSNSDIDLLKIVNEVTPITTSVDCGDVLEQSDRAVLAHRSQLGGMENMQKIPKFLRRRFGSTEHFTLVSPSPRKHETDLFTGI